MSTQTQCARCGDDMAQHETEPRCRYNGWRNYETWAMKLWIDNDQGTYAQAIEFAKAIRREQKSDQLIYSAESQLGLELKSWWEDETPELNGPWADRWYWNSPIDKRCYHCGAVLKEASIKAKSSGA